MATKKVATDSEAEEKAPKTAKKSTTKKTTAVKAASKTTKKSSETAEEKKLTKKKAEPTENAATEVKNVEEKQVVEEKNIVIETHAEETQVDTGVEITIAQKLLSLYNLQQILSQIDKIHVLQGELPEEIRDLDDAHEGMQTRINKYHDDIANLRAKITEEDTKIKEAVAAIKRYEEQQNNVRNNREYESLSKEIEYQKLEIQVCEKHKAKQETEINAKSEEIVAFNEKLKEYEGVLEQKKSELESIIAETQKEEEELNAKAEILKAKVDSYYLGAFERIRKNARNGLAIVQIDRDACGGCFSTIPPQRQLDIRLHKKIIVCEACGRIFIDKQLVETQGEVD